MSATGRSDVRHPDDFYRTPEWCVRAILPHLPDAWRALDPCCGDGAILDVLAKYGRHESVCGIELDAGRAAEARAKGRVVIVGDALTGGLCGNPDCDTWHSPDVVVMNPPFGLALEFVQKAYASSGAVFALLRLNWLASQKRAAWLREHTPSVYVLPKRPSFTGKGTDATDYAWMAWDDKPPTVTILEVT